MKQGKRGAVAVMFGQSMRRNWMRVLPALAVMAVLCLTGTASALTLNPDLCQGAQGSCPQSNWPFIIANITGSGTLTMTLTTSLENNLNQYVGLWAFNLDPSIVPTGAILTFNLTSGEAASIDNINSQNSDNSNPYVVTIQQDAQNIDGGGAYDLVINFNNSGNDGGSHRFGPTTGVDTLVFSVTCSGCTGTFTDQAFNALSTGGGSTPYLGAPGSPHEGQTFVSPFRTIAKIEPAGAFIAGVGPTDQPVPEPGTMMLMGAGVVALGVAVRRRRG
jgi:hypothetical protein